jgi:hypothetical protein
MVAGFSYGRTDPASAMATAAGLEAGAVKPTTMLPSSDTQITTAAIAANGFTRDAGRCAGWAAGGKAWRSSPGVHISEDVALIVVRLVMAWLLDLGADRESIR